MGMSEAPVPILHVSESRPWHKKSTTRWLIMAGLVLLIAGMWMCGRSALGGAKVAKQGALHFHEQFNRSQYHDIYADATQVFRDAGPESETIAFFDKVHQKLGDETRCGEPTFFPMCPRTEPLSR
jgi:ABC-type nickel/cobalt efflux system permease component RcnA